MIRALFLTVVSILPVCAATVEVRNIGPAVAHAYIKGYTGPCKWNLYQGASATGMPHPDVAGVVDTSRADTIYDDFGTRIMRLGHDYGDSFLRVNTQYTLAVDPADTGCAGTAPITFSTYFQPPPVIQRSFIPKWNASTYTKTAEPSYDWTNSGRRKLYVTSPEGVPFEFMDQADVASWYYTYPYTHGADRFAGGSTWTNPDKAANGDTSNYAVVVDTTPVVVFPIGSKDWWSSGVFLTYENFGIVLTGAASDSSNVTNRQLDFCISFRTVAGTCAATGFTVTLPNGLPQAVTSTPNPANVPGAQHNAWPNEFTEPGFRGWNTIITRDRFPVSAGIDAVVNGVVTISSNFTGGNQNYFPYGLEGNYIFIPGSTCPNGMCAVATVESPTHLTLVDTTINAPAGTAIGYPFGIVVRRKSATNNSTVSIGMKFVEQGNVGDVTFGNPPQCHPTGTTYNGIKGHWCANNRQGGVAPLYFIADDAKDRLSGNASAVWPNSMFGMQPNYPIGSGPFVTGPKSDLTKNTSIDQPQDRPSGVLYFASPYGFDPNDGNAFYAVNGCNNGSSMCVFRLTIRDVSPQYQPLSQVITTVYSGHETTWAVGNVYLENMTPPSKGLDIASQISGNPEWAWTRQGIYAAYATFAGANFRGISGTKAFFDVTHGQDNAPSLNAVVEMTTGRVFRVFSTAYNGETGAIPEVRYGIFHSAGAEALPEDAYNISLQFPSRGSNAGGGSFAGSPIAVNVVGVMRGGVMSSNTCLSYPYNDTAFCTSDNGGTPVPAYDNTCTGCASDPSIPDWIKQHWTGTDEFATLDVSTDLCLENPGSAGSEAQTFYPVCGWNSSYRKVPWSLQVGDRFTWYAPNAGLWVCATGSAGDCEILQVVKILNPGSSTIPMRIIVQRDSSFDYSCVTDNWRSSYYPLKTKRPDCRDDITQVKLPNGWRGRMASGRNGGAGTIAALIKFDSTGCPANQTITCGTYTYGEIPAGIGYGHATIGKGSIPGRYTAVGVKTMFNATFQDLTAIDSTKGPVLTNYGFNFAGFGFDLINGYAGKDQISAPAHEQLWSLDFNHLNEPNAGGARIGNARGITPVAGCTNVYKINPANGGYYKISPLLGWAGHNMMEDVSGPAANICAAHDYSFVYIQRTGDTAGLTQAANGVTPQPGDIYIKVPYMNRNDDNSGCLMGWHPYLNDPCLIFLKGAGHGGMRRSYWGGDDASGKFSQFLGYGTGFPGMNRVFSAIHPTATGTTAIAHVGYETQGIRNTGLLFHLPQIRVNENRVNTMFNTTINVGAFPGATHARIKFGFNPNTLYCSGRQETCVTDSVMNTASNPYAYIGETLNPHSCASGCSIPLPLDLGRAFYYQIEWLQNGTVVKSSAVRPIVVN